MYKQVILVRQDLNMSCGKIISSCAHASMMSVINRLKINHSITGSKYKMKLKYNDPMSQWLETDYTKIIVYVDNFKHMLKLKTAAENKNIQTTMVIDANKIEFRGVPTPTVCAIGPETHFKINPITEKLRLV